jgi:hypothetical protein
LVSDEAVGPIAAGCDGDNGNPVGLVKAGAHLFFPGSESGAGAPDLVDVAGDVVTPQTLPGIAMITRIIGDDTAVFILGTDANGNGGIVKYDIASTAFSVLLTPGEYTVSKIAASPGGDVTFCG